MNRCSLTFPRLEGLLKKVKGCDTKEVMEEMACIVSEPFLDTLSRCQREREDQHRAPRVCLWLFPLSCPRIAEWVRQTVGRLHSPSETPARRSPPLHIPPLVTLFHGSHRPPCSYSKTQAWHYQPTQLQGKVQSVTQNCAASGELHTLVLT